MLRLDCHNRIKQVKSSHDAALQTVKVLIQIVISEPDYLYDNDLSMSALRGLLDELHDVYFARMFACFESSLRHYWVNTIRDSKPPAKVLLSSLAGRHGVPQDTLDTVHEIREFRNSLMHEEH